MSGLPGYDEWKLMTPEDERPLDECKFCGSTDDECLWEEADDPPCDAERDPDQWREEREEARRDRETDR